MSNIEEIKQLDIRAYLEYKGIKVSKSGKNYHFSIRDEKNPSCHITYKNGRYLWYDFGTGKGGSIIDLVMLMENTSFQEAIKHLKEYANIRPSISKEADVPIHTTNSAEKEYDSAPVSVGSKIYPLVEWKEDEANKIENLIAYANKRGIKEETLRISLVKFVEVIYGNDGKTFYHLGLKSEKDKEDKGGYALRNAIMKSNHGSTGVTLHSFGEKLPIIIVEGMFDYLSVLQIIGKNRCNFLVLNSIVNKKYAVKVILERSPSDIIIALDADEGGRKTAAELKEELEQKLTYSKIINITSEFVPTDNLADTDINAFLIAGDKRNLKILQESVEELSQKKHSNKKGSVLMM